MSVISSKHALSGHRFSFDGRYQVVFNVETDDRFDLPQSVLSGAQAIGGGNATVPKYGDTYTFRNDTDPFAFATRFDVESRGGTFPNKWRVTVGYERLVLGQENVDPVLRDPLYWIESQQQTRETWKRLDGSTGGASLIRNSAGRLLPDPVEYDSNNVVIRATRNYRTVGQVRELSTEFTYTTNQDPWPPSLAGDDRGARRHWLCHPIESSQLMIHECWQYVVANFKFEYNRDSWNKFIFDRGVLYTDGVAYFQENDEFGNLTAEIVNLDGSGNKLPDGDPPKFIDEPDGFQVFLPKRWDVLGLNP